MDEENVKYKDLTPEQKEEIRNIARKYFLRQFLTAVSALITLILINFVAYVANVVIFEVKDLPLVVSIVSSVLTVRSLLKKDIVEAQKMREEMTKVVKK